MLQQDTWTTKKYRGAYKFLTRHWKETSYSDQTYNTIPRLTAYKQQQYIPVVCTPHVLVQCCKSGRCSLFPSRVGLRTYQHSCNGTQRQYNCSIQMLYRLVFRLYLSTFSYILRQVSWLTKQMHVYVKEKFWDPIHGAIFTLTWGI